MNETQAGLISAAAAFCLCAAIMPCYIRTMKRRGEYCGKDMNKRGSPMVPEMGGIVVVAALTAGAVLYIVLAGASNAAVSLLALATVGLVAAIGFYDDMHGIRRRFKAIFPFLAAVPLGFVMWRVTSDVEFAGLAVFTAPVLGGIQLGWLLILVVPLGVTCAANATNMLEGLNGLAAGLSLIIIMFLMVIAYSRGLMEGLFLLYPMVGALAAFLLFNVYPAKVFPGDVLTLSSGAVMASAAFLGQLKLVGAILLFPMILEFAFKFRGKIRRFRRGESGWGSNFGRPDAKGVLHYDGETESLIHVILKLRPMKEWQVVAVLWTAQAMLGLFAIFYVLTL